MLVPVLSNTCGLPISVTTMSWFPSWFTSPTAKLVTIPRPFRALECRGAKRPIALDSGALSLSDAVDGADHVQLAVMIDIRQATASPSVIMIEDKET